MNGGVFLVSLVAVLALSGTPTRAQEMPIRAAPIVSFCDVVRNPGSYDGKMISIRAKVSHEFEDFTLFDSQCSQQPDIWIWLGGDLQCKDKWEAMDFSCSPGSNLRFRGVEYPMFKDESLETFLKLSSARKNRKPVYRVTATLTGIFFGENPKQDKRLRPTMPGYGHMGCCFQLIVTQVSEVRSSNDVQDRDEEWKKKFERRPNKKAPQALQLE
jgi:hypothetical protein